MREAIPYILTTGNSLAVEYNIRWSRDTLNNASRSSGDTLSTMTISISLSAKYHEVFFFLKNSMDLGFFKEFNGLL